MNRRQAVLALSAMMASVTAAAADPPQVPLTEADAAAVVFTANGSVRLTGKKAKEHIIGEKWAEARFLEATSVKVGSSYADVLKIFRHDGGLTFSESRFVLRVCHFIKIDVKFDRGVLGPDYLYPHKESKIVSISKPYLEWPMYD